MHKSFRMIGLSMFIMLVLCFAAVANAATVLDRGDWSPRNYRVLSDLINDYGIQSANYNVAKKPYAVFDWDNTSIFGDCEETLFMYYINNLLFTWSPSEFTAVLAQDIPYGQMNFKNNDGRVIERDEIIADIVSDYKWLMANYKGYKGALTLEQLHATPQFKDFQAKLFAMFTAVDKTCGSAVADLWEGRLMENVSDKKIREYAYNSIKEHLNSPLKKYRWNSPAELPGKAGVVTAQTDQSLRVQKEMANLFSTLTANGFDVYICSASPEQIVKVFASTPEFGYRMSENMVHGVKFTEEKGLLTTNIAPDHVMTWGIGKVETIQHEFIDKKGYAPLLIGGDSDGDFNMLSQIPGVKLGLILNRAKGGALGSLCKIAVEQIDLGEPRYILQGRDENKGVFIDDESVILIGKSDKKLLK